MKKSLQYIAAVAVVVTGLLVWMWFDTNRLEKNYQSLVEQVGSELHVSHHQGSTPCIEGYVGKHKHYLHMFVDVPARGRKETVVTFSCGDIDSVLTFALAPHKVRLFEAGTEPKLSSQDAAFNQAFELFGNSDAYARKVLTPPVRQTLLDNIAYINGKFELSKSVLRYVTYGDFDKKDIETFRHIINVGTALIERMHDIAKSEY